MSKDLALMAVGSLLFLMLLHCFMLYVIHYEPRGKHPRRHGHGTPYRGRVRRKARK